MFKAVFFDLDETLVKADTLHIEANRKVFKKYHLDWEEIIQKTKSHDFLGRRLVDVLKIMRDAMGVSEKSLPLKTLTTERLNIFLKLIKEQARLLPGAKRALRYVKSKNKVLGIVSSGTRKYINIAIKKFGLDHFVDFVVGEEDVLRGKPNPECYLKSFSLASKIIPLKKEECLVVEDAPNGVIAAKRAGLRVCYVPLFKRKLPLEVEYQLSNLREFMSIPL